MSRRSRSTTTSKSHLAVYIIIGVAVLAALAIGKFILDHQSQAFPNLKELSVDDLKEGATGLSDNEYRITGKITDRRNLSDDRGILVSVTPDQEEKTTGPIPIHVPKGTVKINLERGHIYTFKVKIDQAGIPIAQDIREQ